MTKLGEEKVNSCKVSAVIPAAGQSLRFSGKTPKQFKDIAGQPLLFHTLKPFLSQSAITEIIVVVPTDWIATLSTAIKQIDFQGKIRLVAGGKRRQDSVFNGVKATTEDTEIVIIHDAGRPFVTEQMIIDCIVACNNHDGAIVALPARDTVKDVSTGSHHINGTIPRETIWLAQTPQAFPKKILIEALRSAHTYNISGTDEAALVERLGYQVAVVEGSPQNLKITTLEDWQYAASILERKDD